MFEGEISTLALSNFVKTMKEFLTEVRFRVSSDGIQYRELDSSKAAMVSAIIRADSFNEYKFDQEDEYIFRIGVDFLSKVIKRMKSESVRLKLDREDSRLLVMSTEGSASKQFSIPLLVVLDDEKTKMPSLDDHASIEITQEAFKNAVKDAMIAASLTEVEIGSYGLSLKAIGDTEEAYVQMDYNMNSDVINEPSGNVPTKSTYSLSYLEAVYKSLPDKEEWVTVRVADRKPMRIESKIGDFGTVMFVIAPRLERKR